MTGTSVRILVGEEEYALPVGGVLEITDAGPITPVPGAPQSILGVRNLRGQVMPIVDLSAVLGLGQTTDPNRVVVVEDGDVRAALAVDDVLDVGSVGEATDSADSPYLLGSTFLDGALVGLIDLRAVLRSLSAAPAEV